MCLGWLCRVSIPVPGSDGSEEMFVPSQNPFYPVIVQRTNGYPAYGQMFFAEGLGTVLVVALNLFVKREIEQRFKDPFTHYLALAVGYYALVMAFRDFDAVFNPALAAAGMGW